MRERPTVLCVDDEQSVLEGLTLTLRTSFVTQCFTDPTEALDWLRANPDVTVIVSDMRMPKMNGAEFLAAAVKVAPNSSRILLTGQADIESATRAVNEGRLYKFLTKPCPPQTIRETLEDAHSASIKIKTEEDLLEKTVHGCVYALVEVLVLTKPGALGRAMQMKSIAGSLAEELGLNGGWKVEMAALFCNLGRAFLPSPILAKVQTGQELTDEEEKTVAKTPEIARRILRRIPKLEEIADIISRSENCLDTRDRADIEWATIYDFAEILKVTREFESLQEKKLSDVQALIHLERYPDRYPRAVVTALRAIIERANDGRSVRELTVGKLRVGMMLAEDLFSSTGTLLLSKGQVLSENAVEQLLRVSSGTVPEPILVFVQQEAA